MLHGACCLGQLESVHSTVLNCHVASVILKVKVYWEVSLGVVQTNYRYKHRLQQNGHAYHITGATESLFFMWECCWVSAIHILELDSVLVLAEPPQSLIYNLVSLGIAIFTVSILGKVTGYLQCHFYQEERNQSISSCDLN